MANEFVMNPTAPNPLNMQDLTKELFKKFPNMTPQNPADEALQTDIKEEVKEDFVKAQEIALTTESGKAALKEFEETKKKIIDELVVQVPKGAEALKTYRDKIMAIYKENEALKVEQATKATDELNAKYRDLQKENDSIKAQLNEVLKRLDESKNKAPVSSVFGQK